MADIGEPTALLETQRVYLFPGGHTVTVSEPRELVVRPSGTHRIITEDKKLIVVASGWLAIEISDPSGAWTV